MRWRDGNGHAGTLADMASDRAAAPRRKGSPRPRLSDEQVLEARRLHESQCWPTQRVLAHFGIPYSQSARTWMQSLLAYTIRSSPSKPLDPKLL
jgi:hypothetical protein